METRSVQGIGSEVGIVSHNGQEFAAYGASVKGRHVTGYLTEDKRGQWSLTTWDGRTMLSCRCEVAHHYSHVNEFGDSADAVIWSLTHGRYIAGYSLGVGMLVRAELIDASDAADLAEACEQAIAISERFIESDEQDRLEQDSYCECGEEFDHDCQGRKRCPSCDDPCPDCADGI